MVIDSLEKYVLSTDYASGMVMSRGVGEWSRYTQTLFPRSWHLEGKGQQAHTEIDTEYVRKWNNAKEK